MSEVSGVVSNTLFQLFGTPTVDRRRYLFCSLVWGEIEFLVLVLGSLHYIGHGWTFDDIEEQTTISREMHRLFFHNFINFCSTSLYL